MKKITLILLFICGVSFAKDTSYLTLQDLGSATDEFYKIYLKHEKTSNETTDIIQENLKDMVLELKQLKEDNKNLFSNNESLKDEIADIQTKIKSLEDKKCECNYLKEAIKRKQVENAIIEASLGNLKDTTQASDPFLKALERNKKTLDRIKTQQNKNDTDIKKQLITFVANALIRTSPQKLKNNILKKVPRSTLLELDKKENDNWYKLSDGNFISTATAELFIKSNIRTVIAFKDTVLRTHPYITKNNIYQEVKAGQEFKAYRNVYGFYRLMNGYFIPKGAVK